MSSTTRTAAVTTAIAAALALGVAPASADTSDDVDLAYEYRYSLWIDSEQTPESLTKEVGSQLTAYFPFDSNCTSLPPVGQRCDLFLIPGLPLPGTVNPVKVVERTESSWTFQSLPGHAEGAGRYITYSFVQERFGFELHVKSWGPWTPGASATVQSGSARAVWQRFADKVSDYL